MGLAVLPTGVVEVYLVLTKSLWWAGGVLEQPRCDMSRVCGDISDELRIGASLVVISFKAIRQVKDPFSKWTCKVFSPFLKD